MVGLADVMSDGLSKNNCVVSGNGTFVNSNTSITNNASQEINDRIQPPYSSLVTIIIGIAASLAVTATVFGNSLVLLSFKLERSLRKPKNYFIVSLAISDLFIGMFCMPSFTLFLLTGYWPLDGILCDIWLSLDGTICIVSLYTVLIITTDRFCSLKYPFRYRYWRTANKVKVKIVSVWIVSSIGSFTTVIGWQYFVGKRTVQQNDCKVQFLRDPLFSFLWTVAYFWLAVIVMIALYVGIYRITLSVQRRKQKAKQTYAMELTKNKVINSIIGRGRVKTLGYYKEDQKYDYSRNVQEIYTSTYNSHSYSDEDFSKSTKKHCSDILSVIENRAPKALRTISIILGAYLISWTPFHIMVFVICICGDSTCINTHFYQLTYWLCYLNSSVNPLCYAFANAEFKRTFVRILKLDLHRS